MKRTWLSGLLGCLLLLAVSACGSRAPAPTPIPDPVFPSSVYTNPQALEAYRIAVQMPDLLMLLPCYCGCGKTLGHRNLRDCFLNADGTFDDHAATCAVCDMQAADAAKWKAAGNPPGQIWRLMVAKYDTYGPGTDTPKP